MIKVRSTHSVGTNVRPTAGTNQKPVGVITREWTPAIVGQDFNGWRSIYVPEKYRGWVFSKYIEIKTEQVDGIFRNALGDLNPVTAFWFDGITLVFYKHYEAIDAILSITGEPVEWNEKDGFLINEPYRLLGWHYRDEDQLTIKGSFGAMGIVADTGVALCAHFAHGASGTRYGLFTEETRYWRADYAPNMPAMPHPTLGMWKLHNHDMKRVELTLRRHREIIK